LIIWVILKWVNFIGVHSRKHLPIHFWKVLRITWRNWIFFEFDNRLKIRISFFFENWKLVLFWWIFFDCLKLIEFTESIRRDAVIVIRLLHSRWVYRNLAFFVHVFHNLFVQKLHNLSLHQILEVVFIFLYFIIKFFLNI